MGEQLCIVGDLDEMGQWSNFKCKMKWTEGHIWVLDGLIVKKPYFLYKYVVLQNDQPSKWEQGDNRIADLRVLPEQAPDNDILNQVLLSSSQATKRNPVSKNVELFDEWEAFSIRMQVFVPYVLANNESIYISCSLDGLGTKRNPKKL